MSLWLEPKALSAPDAGRAMRKLDVPAGLDSRT
jgi:hypothetical protein